MTDLTQDKQTVPPVEVARRQVDRLCWSGITLGLAFTMTNVQEFAAAGARAWSLPWLAAWLLDPMVSLVLLAILRAEQFTSANAIATGGWVRGAKWFTLAATYVMNTWSAFMNGLAALVVLHSVPPLVVFVAAEAVTTLRGKLITAANTASDTGTEVANLPAEPTGAPPKRTTFADYLVAACAARTPETEVTPAWVREVTGCSRGLSSRLAAHLRADANSAETGVRS